MPAPRIKRQIADPGICEQNEAQFSWEVLWMRSTHFEEADHPSDLPARVKLEKVPSEGTKRSSPKRKAASKAVGAKR
jgi:hypothetical protein